MEQDFTFNPPKLAIETKNPLFGVYHYPFSKEIMERQQDMMWTAQEIKVEKDTHNFLYDMPKPSRQAVDITLQTFVEIEQEVGNVWEEIGSWFPHSEIDGCCSMIAAMEKSVHAFFYQKMSDVLNIDPKTIAKNQEEIKVIKDKLTLIKTITSNLSEDKPLTLGTVALIEQVLLFSNFALLKSFKANGNNLIQNTLTGVDYVVNDEVLHGVYAAYLHNTMIEEFGDGFLTGDHEVRLLRVAQSIVFHEDSIIDYMYQDVDHINGISADDLKTFVRSRANHVFSDLNLTPPYEIDDNPIADWFYRGANSIKLHDFFVAGTNQYSREWSFDSFSRLPFLKGKTDGK